MAPQETTPPQESSVAAAAHTACPRGQWYVVIAALFLVRSLPWLISQLWYDEVVTLTDFAVGPPGSSPLRVFTSYPVANNHMLFSLVGWWWIRFLDFSAGEHILRAPSVVFALCMLGLIVFHWSKWLGRRLACMGGLLVAVSPVFSSFAYQFRGYSLAMLLAALVWSGILEQRLGSWRRGTAIHTIAAALLVLTIPSNILVVGAGLLFLLWTPANRWGTRRRLLSVAIPAAGAAVGAIPYVLIADQFLAVMRKTAGWDSPWSVFGNLSLAVVAHGGLLCASAAAGLLTAVRSRDVTDDEPSRGVVALRIAVCVLIPVLTALLFSHTAPFPRVFLPFLPMVTYSLLLAASQSPRLLRLSLPVVGLAILFNGLAWERGATWLTQRQIAEGRHPQNLLQQYYRGDTALRTLVTELINRDMTANAIALTDAYDFVTFRYYWAQNDLPAWAVLAANRSPGDTWNHRQKPPGVRLWVIARDEMQAAELLQAAGETRPFYPALTVLGKSVYGLRTD